MFRDEAQVSHMVGRIYEAALNPVLWRSVLGELCGALNGAAAQFVKFSNPCSGADCIEGQLPPHLAGPSPPAGTCPTFWAAVDRSK